MSRTALIFAAMLSTSGCDQIYFPVPTQRAAPIQAVEMTLDMTGGHPAETWGEAVAGIRPEFASGSDWRWAGEASEFRFRFADHYPGWALTARVTAAQAVLQKTGAQKLTFEVNGTTVGAVSLDVSRRYDLFFPVNPDLLRSADPVTVRMKVARCMNAAYGPPYCVLLHSIGFTRPAILQEPR